MEDVPEIEIRGGDGRGLRIVFARAGDRFGHQILLLDGERCLPLLESVEGSPQEPWPPSPPLQQLHLEPRDGGRRVALLVGMAGRGHWSMSVEPTIDPPGLRFDVACRLTQSPAHLGSRYRAVSDILVTSKDDEVLVGNSAAALVRIACHAEDEGVQIRCDDGRHITIVTTPSSGRLPATIRWRYLVEFASS